MSEQSMSIMDVVARELLVAARGMLLADGLRDVANRLVYLVGTKEPLPANDPIEWVDERRRNYAAYRELLLPAFAKLPCIFWESSESWGPFPETCESGGPDNVSLQMIGSDECPTCMARRILKEREVKQPDPPRDYGDSVRCYQDGNMRCAVLRSFVNLQESPAGFGLTDADAIAALVKELAARG